MGSMSIVHWMIVIGIVVLLFMQDDEKGTEPDQTPHDDRPALPASAITDSRMNEKV
jgi:hypothetical protein